MLKKREEYILQDLDIIRTTADLEHLCEALSSQPYVSIDTEFLRDSTYWPELCLIQVASPAGHRAIIDPLGDIDLKPFFAFLGDPGPVKVFHAARQDLEIFFHRGGVIPAPLFDTQIAAMVCGFGESAGYETLVREIAKAQIDKSARFTDWKRRPLSDKQLAYAISDVTHLCTIYEFLKQSIEGAGRTGWIAEEIAHLSDEQTYRLEPSNAWRRLKLRDTRPKAIAAAMELAAWRETMAQKRNVPRARILKDDALTEASVQRPVDRDALARLRAVPRGWEKSDLADGLLRAIATAAKTPHDTLPRIKNERRPPIPPARIDLLRTLLRARAEESNVAPKLIATTDVLEAFARGDPPGDALRHGWRAKVFGSDAEKLLAGQAALALNGTKVELVLK